MKGLLAVSCALLSASAVAAPLRPPAVPLVACDPYFSIWSQADQLTDVDTTHWTGKPHRMTSLLRIDGKTFRIMGADPVDVPALPQTGLTVLPTRTVYTFQGQGVQVRLTFMTPVIPGDLDLLSRPVTYLTWKVEAADAKEHAIEIYFDIAAEVVVNKPSQAVVWSQEMIKDLAVLKMGSKEQAVLGKRGDDIRIDWGYLYAAAPALQAERYVVASGARCRDAFMQSGSLPLEMDPRQPRAANDEPPVAAFVLRPDQVDHRGMQRLMMLAYDDLYSIQYMKKNLRPFWRRHGAEAADLLAVSAREWQDLELRTGSFDQELMADLTAAGGANYAALCALAYRQCFAAGKFVADDNGQPIQFCKEHHSGGFIGTSDVFYPMSPQFLLFGPTLAKSFVVPFMNYAASERWTFPFAPHDLGQYPHANGQLYGGGEHSEKNQMPVEESGNLLILMAAIAHMEGNADFAGLYWQELEQWAEYLKEKGFDPENQLCTDDFAGHLAHNVNLSAKAICGLASFARLCDLRGDKARAREYQALAKSFAARWVEEAADGDHYRLAFDRPGTWSQKYNLSWDRILGFDLFPASVARQEMDYYKKMQNTFGLPLDSRKSYTKLDWVLWTATLTGDRADFEALVDPVVKFLNETPHRSPMTDWYFTDSGKKRGFTARPVVGGVFLRMLYEKDVWAKYAGRDTTKAAGYAPMPKPPKTVTLVSTSEHEPTSWRYTTGNPGASWMAEDFNDAGWKTGEAGFGTRETPGTTVRTVWNTGDIWLRRTFELKDPVPEHVVLRVHHDEDADVFLNGKPALTLGGFTTEYQFADIKSGLLRAGKNTIAIHCRQTRGGQYIDAGIDALVEE